MQGWRKSKEKWLISEHEEDSLWKAEVDTLPWRQPKVSPKKLIRERSYGNDDFTDVILIK